MAEAMTFEHEGETLVVWQFHYSQGDRLALLLRTGDGEQYAVLTVNLPDEPLGPGEFFVKTWNENGEVAASALRSGLFEDTGRRVQTGHAQASVWRLKG